MDEHEPVTEPAVAPPPAEHDAVAEVHPVGTPRELPEEKDVNKGREASSDGKRSLPGWPRVRFHPVHGRREFADPYEAVEFGQDDEKGDWRFKSASEADMHRTDTEAGLAVANNMRTKLAAIDEAEQPVVRNSVAAQESLDSGHAEPL